MAHRNLIGLGGIHASKTVQFRLALKNSLMSQIPALDKNMLTKHRLLKAKDDGIKISSFDVTVLPAYYMPQIAVHVFVRVTAYR